ncbi:MAG: RHS repeat protein [Chitinophagaceae bacterium]|nr:RHS repeat protein [Chitinophagaceae bacterium]
METLFLIKLNLLIALQVNYLSFSQGVSYDSRNRPIQTSDPLGNKVSFIYDDRNLKTSVINALGQQVNLYYDINGLTIKTGLIRTGNEIIINQWNRDLIGRLNSYQDAEK